MLIILNTFHHLRVIINGTNNRKSSLEIQNKSFICISINVLTCSTSEYCLLIIIKHSLIKPCTKQNRKYNQHKYLLI